MNRVFSNLKKRNEFLKVRETNKFLLSKYLIINFKKNPTTKGFRFGLTVSKKHGSAVQRNYIKRLIRAVVIKNVNIFCEGFDFEFIPKKNFKKTNFERLDKDIKNSIKKIE